MRITFTGEWKGRKVRVSTLYCFACTHFDSDGQTALCQTPQGCVGSLTHIPKVTVEIFLIKLNVRGESLSNTVVLSFTWRNSCWTFSKSPLSQNSSFALLKSVIRKSTSCQILHKRELVFNKQCCSGAIATKNFFWKCQWHEESRH